MPGRAVINANGRASISAVDPNTDRALIFRDVEGEPICDECCACAQRCITETQGYGCVLGAPSEEKARITMTGSSSGVLVEECEEFIQPTSFKATAVSGNGSVIRPPSFGEFQCDDFNGYVDNVGFIYDPGEPPGFCQDCPDCPSFGLFPTARMRSIQYRTGLRDLTVSGPCMGGDNPDAICFGELAEQDQVFIPDLQQITVVDVFLHSDIQGGFCPSGCFAKSWHETISRFILWFSPVTDRHAGFIDANLNRPDFQGEGPETGSLTLDSVVAIIRGGLAGVRWATTMTSTIDPDTTEDRTRNASYSAEVDMLHFGTCCNGGSQRVEDVTLVGPGGGGAAFARDPVFHRPGPIVVARPKRIHPRHRRSGKSCGGCRSSDLVFPTASEVKNIAGSRSR